MTVEYIFEIIGDNSQVKLKISDDVIELKIASSFELEDSEYSIEAYYEYYPAKDIGKLAVLIPYVAIVETEVSEDSLVEFLDRLVVLVSEFFKDFVEARIEVEEKK